jgi:NTE family protein
MNENKEQHELEQAQRSETILVLQGGGSLGAYECGVYKTIAKHGIEFDILAGSSIGAINSSIICSAQNANKDAAKFLEDFWLTLAESSVPPIFPVYSILPFTPLSSSSSLTYDKMMAIISSMYSVVYGNTKAFRPRWFEPCSLDYFLPYKWNYLYDSTLLKNTLERFIDFNYVNIIKPSEGDKKNDNINKDGRSRLVITSTDIQKGEPVIFDNYKTNINIDSIISCAAYPFYGIKWSTKDGKYLWDGSLLSNTPLIEVIKASPGSNKKFFIVDIFPREQNKLPTNMVEVWHRAKDIMFNDKTSKSIEMLKIRERHISLLKKLHEIINADDVKIDEKSKAKFKKVESEYNELISEYGGIIEEVTRIGRTEKMH